MSWNLFATLALLVSISLPRVVLAEGPSFTFAAGLGLSHQELTSLSREGSINSYASPTLRVGWFVLPELALAIKAAATWNTPTQEEASGVLIQSVILPTVQYWPSRTFYVEVGPVGYSASFVRLTRATETSSGWFTGVGAGAALGFVFWRAGHHVLSTSFDVSQAAGDDFENFTLSALLNWQYL